ncbi:MAG: hypothetical protein HC927_11065 [Deltaproteobacteria bacterium]|nr:hypothetical protein [Deltaproteobacteria bacterium]
MLAACGYVENQKVFDGEETSDSDGFWSSDEATSIGDETTETTETTTGDVGIATGDTSADTAGDLPDGAACTSDAECLSANCYTVPFLGGYCGECTNDDDCSGGGCTAPNPFDPAPISTCNMGELGGGCESDEVCEKGLTCGNVLDLLGLIKINTCGNCSTTDDCIGGQICAPIVVVEDFSGIDDCIDPGTLPQNSFCQLPPGNGAEACEDFCSVVDIMGIAQIGACGECESDADCGGGTCTPGEFVLDSGMLLGSTCQ